MEFFETIHTRKTIRKYKQGHPPIEEVKKIVNSARLAPSATNSQNWRFIVIYNDAVKQKMAKAVEEVYDGLSSMVKEEELKAKITHYKHFSTFFKEAPVVIACVETERKSAITEFMKGQGVPYEQILLSRPDSSLLSMGGAIENMSLAAAALGYGTCWMCAPIIAYKEFKKILGLSEEEKIVSLLTLGEPDGNNTQRPPKKSLDEIMSVVE